ncbi:hypothetical protein [Arenimonas sp.]|uniref:hypothetical protein n=1 Tax=Arenimonas sp. TaxID=1872635 RepID=UPI0039E62C9C
MKLAPWLAGTSLALLLATVATAKYADPASKTVALDVKGVHILEVRGDADVSIEISARRVPSYTYRVAEGNDVSVERVGERLMIRAKSGSSMNLGIAIPPTIDTFVVEGAGFEAEAPIERAIIGASGYVHWSGDVDKLVFHDGGVPCDCKTRPHGNFTVRKGRIGELQVLSGGADVNLHRPSTIGKAELRLGDGDLTVNNARRLEHIHLIADPAGPDDEDDDDEHSWR